MNKRDYSIDFIKAVAIFAVVIIHTSTAFLDRTLPLNFNFDLYLFVNQITRFAVPLFFAASGLLLAGRYGGNLNTLTFYKKRVIRVIPPYLLWSLIYYVVVYPNQNRVLLSPSFIGALLTGGASYQLYFIPVILILYFLFPLFIKFKKIFLSVWFLVLLFIASSVILENVYINAPNYPLPYPILVVFYNLFPFLAGMYAAVHKEKLSKILGRYNWLTIILFFIVGIFVFLESFILFKFFNQDRFMRNQWRPTVMVYSLFTAIFLNTFYKMFLRPWTKVVFFMSKMSFGVFFIHVWILQLALNHVLDTFKLYGIIYFFLTMIAVLAVSTILTYLFSKIPVVGKYISAT